MGNYNILPHLNLKFKVLFFPFHNFTCMHTHIHTHVGNTNIYAHTDMHTYTEVNISNSGSGLSSPESGLLVHILI